MSRTPFSDDEITGATSSAYRPNPRNETRRKQQKYQAEMAALPDLVAFIDAFCAAEGAGERETAVVQLVAEEVFANIVHHGEGSHAYNDSAPPFVTISASRVGQTLRFAIEDEGPAFDPTAQAEADVVSDLDDRVIGGLGVHFLRHFMDEVHYQRLNSSNLLVLVKYFESLKPK